MPKTGHNIKALYDNMCSATEKVDGLLQKMTSWHGNTFHITGPLWGKSIRHCWIFAILSKLLNKKISMRYWYFQHSPESSNELPDLHTTQTLAGEVHASVVTEWPPAGLHNLLPREHQRGNWRKSWMKDFPTTFFSNICPTNPIQVLNQYGNFQNYVCVLQMIFLT